MDLGDVRFIKPEHPLLQKWIKGYYIHKSADPDFYCKLTFYQNITTTISIYKDSTTVSDGRYRKEYHKANLGYKSLLAGLVDRYQEVEFFGPLDRLAIVFYPSGLNHFMREPLGPHLEKHFSFFHYFQKEFAALLPTVYDEDDLSIKREMLDAFFLGQFRLLDEPKLLKAVDLLTKSSLKVGELADTLEVSRRTLLRKFKKHLGYSIEEYMSVIKFRKALLNFQRYEGEENLTRIALDSNYYDQADFNHALKSRSDLTPSELFSKLEIVDDTLFWKL